VSGLRVRTHGECGNSKFLFLFVCSFLLIELLMMVVVLVVVGLDVSGLVGVWFQVGCLLLAVLPATLAKLGTPLASSAVAVVLMAGVALSRFGLWTFDLVSAQILQERVLPHELGLPPSMATWRALFKQFSKFLNNIGCTFNHSRCTSLT
jgi:hypothetical protein